MPRVALKADVYAANAFFKNLDHKKVDRGIPSDRQLSLALGYQENAVSRFRQKPARMTLGTLQNIAKLLSPDIAVVLPLLGYTPREIDNFKKRKEQNYET